MRFKEHTFESEQIRHTQRLQEAAKAEAKARAKKPVAEEQKQDTAKKK